MKLDNWLKNNNVKVLIITMPNASVKQQSIKKIMRKLKLKKGKDWDFLKATTRDTSTWRTTLKEDFGYSEKDTKDLKKFFRKDTKWHGMKGSIYDIIKGNVTEKNKFARGVIGNTFSVARCLQEGVKTNRNIMIMEDDACLGDDWEKFNPSNFKKNWDLFYLGHCYSTINRKEKPVITDDFHKVLRVRGTACLHSMLVKPQMAKLLVENYFPIFDASDEYIRKTMQLRKRKGYIVQPPVFYQNIKFESDLRSPEDIQQELEESRGKFGPCDE